MGKTKLMPFTVITRERKYRVKNVKRYTDGRFVRTPKRKFIFTGEVKIDGVINYIENEADSKSEFKKQVRKLLIDIERGMYD